MSYFFRTVLGSYFLTDAFLEDDQDGVPSEQVHSRCSQASNSLQTIIKFIRNNEEQNVKEVEVSSVSMDCGRVLLFSPAPETIAMPAEEGDRKTALFKYGTSSWQNEWVTLVLWRWLRATWADAGDQLLFVTRPFSSAALTEGEFRGSRDKLLLPR